SASDRSAGSGQRLAVLHQQLTQIAVALDASVQGSLDLPATRRAIHRSMESRQQRRAFLWIVDDLPRGVDRDELGMWVAPHPAGKTLLTTRTREYDGYGTLIDLDVLDPDPALELF